MQAVPTCFFGVPAMGSWQVRARQVASTRPQWTAVGEPAPATMLGHELFCAVKRPFRRRLRLLRALGKTTVYDVVDCWSQPEDGLRHPDQPSIRRYFEQWFADLPVDGVIFPNRTMCEDLGDLVPNPTWIYHHYWPGLEPIELRPRARVVGYQGEPHYLGPWRAVIERACRDLGLRFVVNPRDLRELDIGIAARGGEHASRMAQRYKSNVKLANFYGAAIPCLVQADEASYRECDHGEVRTFATAPELRDRLAELVELPVRQRVHEHFRSIRARYSLDAIAEQYEAYFARLQATRMPRLMRAAGG